VEGTVQIAGEDLFAARDEAARRIERTWRNYTKQRGLQRMRNTIFGGLGFSDIVKAAMHKQTADRNLEGHNLGESTRYAGKWRHKVKGMKGTKAESSRQQDQEQGAGWMGLEEESQNRGAVEAGIVL
jgi:hypothetical protein